MGCQQFGKIHENKDPRLSSDCSCLTFPSRATSDRIPKRELLRSYFSHLRVLVFLVSPCPPHPFPENCHPKLPLSRTSELFSHRGNSSCKRRVLRRDLAGSPLRKARNLIQQKMVRNKKARFGIAGYESREKSPKITATRPISRQDPSTTIRAAFETSFVTRTNLPRHARDNICDRGSATTPTIQALVWLSKASFIHLIPANVKDGNRKGGIRIWVTESCRTSSLATRLFKCVAQMLQPSPPC